MRQKAKEAAVWVLHITLPYSPTLWTWTNTLGDCSSTPGPSRVFMSAKGITLLTSCSTLEGIDQRHPSGYVLLLIKLDTDNKRMQCETQHPNESMMQLLGCRLLHGGRMTPCCCLAIEWKFASVRGVKQVSSHRCLQAEVFKRLLQIDHMLSPPLPTCL